MFKFLKKAGGDAPPDVGQEEVEAIAEKDDSVDEKLKGGIPKLSTEKQVAKKEIGGVPVSDGAYSTSGLEVERLKAKMDSIVEWINQFYERFSYVSESIGEIRGANLDNEKKILSATKEAEKVIDIVKEVKPDKLRLDYQKVDMRVKLWEEKLDANKLVLEDVLKEFNELKKKAEVFTGVEGVLKLNEEVKVDLLEIQKISSKVRMYADKTEDIFQEIRNDFAETQKTLELVHNLDANYAGLKNELEKLRIDHQRVVGQKDFANFQKVYGDKLSVYDSSVAEVENLKQKLGEIDGVVGTVASVSKKNQNDLLNISLKTGNEDTNVVSEFKMQLSDLVLVVETLTGQVSEIKKRMGIRLSPVKEVKKSSIIEGVKGGDEKSDKGKVEVEKSQPVEEKVSKVPVVETSGMVEKESEGKSLIGKGLETSEKTFGTSSKINEVAQKNTEIPSVVETPEKNTLSSSSKVNDSLSKGLKKDVLKSFKKSLKSKKTIKKDSKKSLKSKKSSKKKGKKSSSKLKKSSKDENYKDQLKENSDDVINKILNKEK